MPPLRRSLAGVLAVAFLAFVWPPHATAYSVLSHEEIVDLMWAPRLQPILLARYPGLTPDQLHEAHGYAYGGAIVDDLGYYPFGNRLFSDLAHYVRSGDLVEAMLHDANTPDELAFALGALAHYVADTDGHPAINRSVAEEYPRLERRFGQIVTYADNHPTHLRTELSFDIEQVAQYRYAAQAYNDFVGFGVSVPLLERVYPEVYGLPLAQVLPNRELAINTFRYAVSDVLPRLTQQALRDHQKEFVKQDPSFDKSKFLYRLSRAQFEKQWGRNYRRPDIFRRLMGELILILPKVGPLSALAFHMPSQATMALYTQSLNTTTDQYRADLDNVRGGGVTLPNLDLDTGAPTRRGEYLLTDQACRQLLEDLDRNGFANAPVGIRQYLLAFYADPAPPGRLSDGEQEKLNETLSRLRAVDATAAP